MVSSSKDMTSIIWEVSEQGNLTIKHKLLGHTNAVAFAAWSWDDELLATCGYQELVRIWEVNTGVCIHTFDKFAPYRSCCVWIPKSKELIFANSGYNSYIFKYELVEDTVEELIQNIWGQLTGMVIAKNGELLIGSYMEGHILCWKIEEKLITFKKFNVIPTFPICALSVLVTLNGEYLGVTFAGSLIHTVEVSTLTMKSSKSDEEAEVDEEDYYINGTLKESEAQFVGYQQENYYIGSILGKSEAQFVASGSEDAKVYLWSRNGELDTLVGHSKSVNSLSWNSKCQSMLASASDDTTIRIWGHNC